MGTMKNLQNGNVNHCKLTWLQLSLQLEVLLVFKRLHTFFNKLGLISHHPEPSVGSILKVI